jgi:hypothetical protein
VNKAKNIINFLEKEDFPEQEKEKKQENAIAGLPEDTITKFIFDALSGEKEGEGVKVKAETMGIRKSPLNIKAEMNLGGKVYHIKAEIPYQAVRITDVK